MSNYSSTQYFMDESIKTITLYRTADPLGQAVILAGGKNILAVIGGDGSTYSITVQIDAVLNDDPDVHVDYFFLHMVKYTYGAAINGGVPDHGYDTSDHTEITEAWNDVRQRTLITDEETILIAGDFRNGCTGGVLLAAYMGSIINPEAYSGIDPFVLHNEYIEWMGIENYDVRDKGVFMYPLT
jgi:iron complex transport system substrate-binding protein